MVLDDLSQKERRGLLVTGIALTFVSVAAGFAGGNMSSPTGEFAGESASIDEIRSTADSLIAQQVSSQQQRLAQVANQSENISESDLSFSGEVTEVSDSEFPSLYEVTVSFSGDTVNRLGQTQEIDEEQKLFISKDGRYLFQAPTDLEAQQQQTRQQGSAQTPSTR